MQKIDLKGQKFGRLTVIEQAPSHKTPNGSIVTMWRCECDCGTKDVLRSSKNLRTVPTPSCGCYKSEKTSERKLIDLTEQRFGRLTVVRRVDAENTGTSYLCKCDCGKEIVALANNLRRGHTTSCGCYREEKRPTLRYKHGYTHSRIYEVWYHLKDRCNNPNNPRYSSYGGRGITLCKEWYDPKAFIEWAYANGYKDDAEYGETTVDRINNNKGYSPDNCRIADAIQQSNNRRTNKFITYNGETHTVAEWSRILGINQGTLTAGLWQGRPFEHYVNDFKPKNTHPNKKKNA